MWGLAPLLYKALAHVPPGEVLAHRVVWGMLFIGAFCLATGRTARLGAALLRPAGAVAALLIAFNWGLFIWAIAAGRAVEASLGYFVYPVISVLLGVAVFRERLSRVQCAAAGLALAAVPVLALGLGAAPWVALALACSFAVYGAVKKRWPAGPIVSVAAECALVAPFCAAWIAWAHLSGASVSGGAFGAEAGTTALLVLSGLVTAVPLILFAEAARVLPFSTVGISFYVNPTLQFLVAVLVFREPFTASHAAAFALIWTGIALFTREALRRGR